MNDTGYGGSSWREILLCCSDIFPCPCVRSETMSFKPVLGTMLVGKGQKIRSECGVTVDVDIATTCSPFGHQRVVDAIKQRKVGC